MNHTTTFNGNCLYCTNRKRFIKLCMAIGWKRNDANKAAEIARAFGVGYQQMWLEMIGTPLRVSVYRQKLREASKVTERIEDEFIYLVDQLDTIEDCANSIIEHIVETKEDMLKLENFISRNMGNAKQEVRSAKHGKWKQVWGWNHDRDEPISISECSECKERYEFEKIMLGKPRYCPNCGTRMDGKIK